MNGWSCQTRVNRRSRDRTCPRWSISCRSNYVAELVFQHRSQRGFPETPQKCAHACKQLLGIEQMDELIVRAHVQSMYAVVHLCPGGKHIIAPSNPRSRTA